MSLTILPVLIRPCLPALKDADIDRLNLSSSKTRTVIQRALKQMEDVCATTSTIEVETRLTAPSLTQDVVSQLYDRFLRDPAYCSICRPKLMTINDVFLPSGQERKGAVLVSRRQRSIQLLSKSGRYGHQPTTQPIILKRRWVHLTSDSNQGRVCSVSLSSEEKESYRPSRQQLSPSRSSSAEKLRLELTILSALELPQGRVSLAFDVPLSSTSPPMIEVDFEFQTNPSLKTDVLVNACVSSIHNILYSLVSSA